MKDKLEQFFLENNFDFHEPHSGHIERFKRKLKNHKKENKSSWKWLSIAASIVLLIGFWLGSNQKQLDLADISPKMKKTQNYFVSTINQELKELEKHRNSNTETIIKDISRELKKLEDNYNNIVQELNKNGYEKRIIHAMIMNYQQCLEVLENALTQIENLKNNQKINTNETYI